MQCLSRSFSAVLMIWAVGACSPDGESGTEDSGNGDGIASGSTVTASNDSGEAGEGAPEGGEEGEGSAGGCNDAAGEFADCLNRNLARCGAEAAGCLVNNTNEPTWGVCNMPCETACDCWAAPETGAATPACRQVLQSRGTVCILDCSGGRACPDDMRCTAISGVDEICVYDKIEDSGTGTTG